MTEDSPLSILDALQFYARNTPNSVAISFLQDGTEEVTKQTYSQLLISVSQIASRIADHAGYRDRVLLALPAGLGFVHAVLGCLWAGAIPVPVNIPRPNRSVDRLLRLQQTTKAYLAITTEHIRHYRSSLFGSLRCSVLTIEEMESNRLISPRKPAPDDIAYLQYTSGSTKDPKGVMISYRNLSSNCASIASASQCTSDDVVVSWLPLFHDMGLVGGLFVSLFTGCHFVLMSPESFVMKPVRWLNAISKYNGTISPAPNFAYDLCCSKINEEQMSGLSLKSWKVAWNGAEMVRPSTIERFTNRFSTVGFKPTTMRPCYGLAEATLLVSCTPLNEKPISLSLHRKSLERGIVQEDTSGFEVVSCGQPVEGTTVAIVDQNRTRLLEDGFVGDVWISSNGVSAGYWDNTQATEETFQKELGSLNGSFLNTGDVGFLLDGNLYITGRSKDLIIIDGRNISPEDLEIIVEESVPSIKIGSAVAFSVACGQREQIVLIVGIDERSHDSNSLQLLANEIRAAITYQADVPIHEIRFVRRYSLPKTSSGKKQRKLCRDLYIMGSLESI